GCCMTGPRRLLVENPVEIMMDSCVKPMNYWDQLRNYLQQKISAEAYENWLKGTSFVGLEGGTLYVSVPDRETRAWLESEYAQLLRNGIQELGLRLRQVSFETQPMRGARNQAMAAVEAGPAGPAETESQASA